jgi:FHA domain
VSVPLTLKVFKGEDFIVAKDYDRDIIKIGRLSSAHLCLDDEKVSRIHSVIEVSQDGSLSIIDMGSVEGTFVNGKRVNKGALSFGDEIRVGGTTIRIDASGQATAVAPGVAPMIPLGAEAPPATQPAIAAASAVANGFQHAATMTPQVSTALPTEPVIRRAPAARNGEAVAAPVQQEQSGAIARGRPARRKGAGPLGVELRFMWGDKIVAEHFIAPNQKVNFKIGSAPKVDFDMGDSRLDGSSFELLRCDKGNATIRFTSKMDGELHLRNGEKVIPLEEARKSGAASPDGDGMGIMLGADDFVWIDLGGVIVEASLQPVPKAVFVPFAETVDFLALNIFLVVFFLGLLFAITAANRAEEGDEYADELSDTNARIAKLLIKPPEIKKSTGPAGKKDSGEAAAKHKGDEGKMGKKDAPVRSAHAAPKGDPNNKDQARQMMSKLFGGSGGLSTVMGPNGLGGELKSAMGNMFGAAAGDANGLGGLGLRGSGSGGGGIGDSIGIGGIGTKGRGGGTGGYGSGVGSLSGKKSVDPTISSDDATVMGSLDKELIRQVIRRNAGQIRYCYENLLAQFPKLGGKVSIKFIITATGSVSTSQVAGSDAGNRQLESCVAGRVQTFLFPKPKGGGVVVVTYPFIFKQSGS